jgi:hypothetical protein
MVASLEQVLRKQKDTLREFRVAGNYGGVADGFGKNGKHVQKEAMIKKDLEATIGV